MFNFHKTTTMKTSLIFACLIAMINLSAQSLYGSWQTTYPGDDGNRVKMVVIFSEHYQVATQFRADNGDFMATNGGSWTLDGNTMTEVVEFDSRNPERVGDSVQFNIELKENTLQIIGQKFTLQRIDGGSPGKLAGAWLMSGRKRNGVIQTRDTNRPRKTMKILSGKRFQWIAYDTATKEFKGTGGGSYTTVNGNYIETIEFFSRDRSRVGASLEFNYELVDGAWHHSGLSSKGEPLYEIWSKRK
jgi:hypothetical protein